LALVDLYPILYEARLSILSTPYQLIDLFCGAGGMTLGFVDKRYCGGFKSIFAIDSDSSAVRTYKENFGNHCIDQKVETWLIENSPSPADVVIGGPPCQGFSLLNRNRERDVRKALWEPFMEIVQKSGALIFVMENVPGLLKSHDFQDIYNYSKKIGFNLINPSVLNTADYGVPQNRNRTIIIGIKTKHFDLDNFPIFPPTPTHLPPEKAGFSPKWRTVREFIGDLPPPKGTELRILKEDPEYLHFGRNPTSMSKERYRAVPKGGNRFDLHKNRPDITPRCWIDKKNGGTDLFGRMWWDRPSVTIRTEFFKPEKGRYLHPVEHRPITHREAARLMSFPDNFVFLGSKIEIARQIGNAVPPVFAGQIGKYVQVLLSTKLKSKKAA